LDQLAIDNLSVLIGEPSSTQRRIIATELQKTGIVKIDFADSGQTALDKMCVHVPDLVISVMHYADMTGTDLVQNMRQLDQLRDVPFLLISSETDVRLLDPIRQAGVVAILPKPFQTRNLLRALSTTLDILEPDRTYLAEHTPEELRALIVDDSTTARRHIRRVLGNMGIEQFHEAGNGKEAIALLNDHFFDLVVTDYNMPEMDGQELVTFIRNESSQAGIPVLMVTSEADSSRLASVKQEGVSAICDKPFEPQTVRALLQRVLV
jgi:two-component system chemotaxis response regulator CheY